MYMTLEEEELTIDNNAINRDNDYRNIVLGSDNNDIRLGAIRLGKAMVETITQTDWRSVPYRRTTKNMIDWKLVWPLLQQEDEEQKICGISLLALTNYPRCPQLSDVITMIRSSTSEGELGAWVTFLKSSNYVQGIRDSKVVAQFLGDLLDNIQLLPYWVRSAALNSYWSLIAQPDAGFEGDESKLGLRLGVTLP